MMPATLPGSQRHGEGCVPFACRIYHGDKPRAGGRWTALLWPVPAALAALLSILVRPCRRPDFQRFAGLAPALSRWSRSPGPMRAPSV